MRLTPAQKAMLTRGGTWCERCAVVHPMSRARGAVPSECQECQVRTTDVHLITVVAKVDGKQAIGLVLACSVCARRGLTVDLADVFGVDASRVEVLEARA